MKALIVTINNRINLEEKNIRSLEVIYLRKYLLRNFDEVDYGSRWTKKEKDIENYYDIGDINVDKYSALFIHNSNCNFFGGIIKDEVIETIKVINKFEGPIYYVITDPKLKFVPFADIIHKRKPDKLTKQDVEIFNSKKIKALWTGRDYDLYCSNLKEIVLPFESNIPLFEMIFKDKFEKIEKSELPPIFDLCYYGNNRGGYRKKMLDHYFKGGFLKSYFIGFDPGYKNTSFIGYVDNKKLANEVQKAKASIVIGDKEHNDNIITARFYENIIFNILSFIDINYDTKKVLYVDPMLQELMYVGSIFDIINSLNTIKREGLYDVIIDKQTKELERHFDTMYKN
jgi:hypothetical protein